MQIYATNILTNLDLYTNDHYKINHGIYILHHDIDLE